jgi:hypothetical protein
MFQASVAAPPILRLNICHDVTPRLAIRWVSHVAHISRRCGIFATAFNGRVLLGGSMHGRLCRPKRTERDWSLPTRQSGSKGSPPDGDDGGRRVIQKQYAQPGGVSLLPSVKYMMPRMTSDSEPPGSPTDLTPFAAELRGTVMLEAMVAAFAIISFADRTSSLIERW